jgi:hypothetical protein
MERNIGERRLRPVRNDQQSREFDCDHFCAHAESKTVIIGHLWVAIRKLEGAAKWLRGNNL